MIDRWNTNNYYNQIEKSDYNAYLQANKFDTVRILQQMVRYKLEQMMQSLPINIEDKIKYTINKIWDKSVLPLDLNYHPIEKTLQEFPFMQPYFPNIQPITITELQTQAKLKIIYLNIDGCVHKIKTDASYIKNLIKKQIKK